MDRVNYSEETYGYKELKSSCIDTFLQICSNDQKSDFMLKEHRGQADNFSAHARYLKNNSNIISIIRHPIHPLHVETARL